jgi:uncharacterized 2Fe-2S/4Fe-4S cluster protein (DUF4445 family)
MPECTVSFYPQNKTVKVNKGTNLLKAALRAHITINNLCGGDGICGRCKMIIKKGEISGEISGKLTREEIKKGYVLACMTFVQSDLVVELPKETWAREKKTADKDAERFRDFQQLGLYKKELKPAPLIAKLYMELGKPSIANNTADQQRICNAIRKGLKTCSTQMGLKIIKGLPAILRKSNYKITATVGLRGNIAEIMNIEEGNTEKRNYMIVIDMGTTTVVAHLVDANSIKTIDAKACFNSQGIYGSEVTGRIISAEKKGTAELQKLLIEDINMLISDLAAENNITQKDITAVVCAGNTIMSHFLLGLPTQYIRRAPYVPTSVEPPPLRAAEVGIEINSRGLLYSLPGISGWVGSDITAGILFTKIHDQDELSMLVDIGTNGEIVLGNKDWLVACSASAGPALEGATQKCGMRAEKGAIEKVFVRNGEIHFTTIGNGGAKGFCGSGIIDLLSVLLKQGIIDRAGKIVAKLSDRVKIVDGIKRFILIPKKNSEAKEIFITEADIEKVITAKAAIFAAMRILLKRLDLDFKDIKHFYLAGAFGNYIDVANAIHIGLIPNIPQDRIVFVGNTSIKGAKIVAFYKEAFFEIARIREHTTYYDLMGAEDYVSEFTKAMFLPHTDIELFQRN